MLNDMNFQSRKLERQRQAMIKDAQKRLVRLVSLSQALMRSRSVRDVLQGTSPSSIEPSKIKDEVVNAVKFHAHSDTSRTNDLSAIYLALIYPVVEKWRLWGFVDRTVDNLLSQGNTKNLKDFRDAVFHASEFNDKDLQIPPSLIEWTFMLDDALGKAIRNQIDNPSLIFAKNDIGEIRS